MFSMMGWNRTKGESKRAPLNLKSKVAGLEGLEITCKRREFTMVVMTRSKNLIAREIVERIGQELSPVESELGKYYLGLYDESRCRFFDAAEDRAARAEQKRRIAELKLNPALPATALVECYVTCVEDTHDRPANLQYCNLVILVYEFDSSSADASPQHALGHFHEDYGAWGRDAWVMSCCNEVEAISKADYVRVVVMGIDVAKEPSRVAPFPYLSDTVRQEKWKHVGWRYGSFLSFPHPIELSYPGGWNGPSESEMTSMQYCMSSEPRFNELKQFDPLYFITFVLLSFEEVQIPRDIIDCILKCCHDVRDTGFSVSKVLKHMVEDYFRLVEGQCGRV